MKKLISLLLLSVTFAFADEGSDAKHPWYTDFYGNNIFSSFQLNEQLDVPEEFGNLDTTKQDFMMRLSSENIKSLYYSRGYFSLDMKMEIRRQYISTDSIVRGYLFTINEGDRYRFNGATITTSTETDVQIKPEALKTNQDRFFEHEDIAEDIQYIQSEFRRVGYLHVYVTPMEILDTVQKKIHVQINVESGPKVMMGNIISSSQKAGNRKSEAEEIGRAHV